ncbi:MAG: hypothetical protein WCF36_20970 [Candidatus Nanopelagicales bacterium]
MAGADEGTGLMHRPDAPAGRSKRADRVVVLALVLLALAVRFGVVWSSGGLGALNGYDDGVYFSATTGLLHGLVPYRDFVLLHPPGMLVLAAGPISAAYAAGLSDSDALAVMRVLFVCLGGINTALVFLAGRHLSRVTGVVAGSLYAVWGPAIREERTMLLEAVVILGMLTALALVPAVSNREVSGRWRPLVAGLVGGLAVATKLWALVPVVLIFGALLVVGRWRRALAYAASATAAAAAIAGPFLVLAPGPMWRMVVLAQAGRPERGENRLARFAEMGNLSAWPFSVLADPTLPTGPVDPNAAHEAFLATGVGTAVTATVVVLAVVAAIVVAWRLPPARTWVALLVVASVVLLATPIFYSGYASFVAPAAVLVLGAVAHLVWTSSAVRDRRVARVGVAASATVLLVLMTWGAVLTDRGAPIRPPLGPVVADATCVASDSPAAIVLADRLRANLDNGCPPVFDFSGVVYTFDRAGSGPAGPTQLREESAQFQAFVVNYFGRADHVILRRRSGTGLSQDTMDLLASRPVLRSTYPRVYGPLGSSGTDATAAPADESTDDGTDGDDADDADDDGA